MKRLKSINFVAALSLFMIVAYAIFTMISMPILGAQPETVIDVFNLLENERILALIRLDILTVLVMPLYFVIYYAIFGVIKKVNQEWAVFFIVLYFVGIVLFLATPSAYSLIPLSDTYHSTSDPMVKEHMIAAAEALRALDMWHMTGAVLGSILSQVAGGGISLLMMKCSMFGRRLGLLGVIIHVLDLIHFVFYVVNLELLSTIFIGIAGVLYLPLYLIIGLRLLKLSKSEKELIDENTNSV
jgi:hypothetical protein